MPPQRPPSLPEWTVTPGLTSYPEALAEMEARAAAIHAGTAPERIWLIEHPPLYTAGTSAAESDLRNPAFPVYAAGRGGKYTYHGPGQRVAYVQLDLATRGRDIRAFVHALESWVIATLGDFGVTAFAVPDRIGIWTRLADGSEAKIGAIGVRVRRWVTLHGLSVNIAPDLGHFGGIVPCGISEHGVTSLAALGSAATMGEFDEALRKRLGIVTNSLVHR
ncbi:MAG: lipoyl(octanoyl) transferase LipB [Sphingomonadales bacterium]|nr:lipoyl(octanoyl) transferase LipB [Sphingomonadales bacterium]